MAKRAAFSIAMVAILVVVVMAARPRTEDCGPYTWRFSRIDELTLKAGVGSLPGNVLIAGGDAVYIGSSTGDKWRAAKSGIRDCEIVCVLMDTEGVMYAGCGRGVYRSTDKGSSWHLANKGLPPVAVQDLFIDSKGRVFATANDGYLFRSDNGAESWVQVRKGKERGPAIRGIAESREGAIFIGTGYGRMYKSTDGGTKWLDLTDKLEVMPKSGRSTGIITSMTADADGHIYAAVCISRFNAGMKEQITPYILRSDDEGQTWTQVPTGKIRFSLSTVLAAGKGNTLFLGNRSGLYATDDAGKKWTQVPLKAVRSQQGLAALNPLQPVVSYLEGEPCIRSISVDREGNVCATTFGEVIYGKRK